MLEKIPQNRFVNDTDDAITQSLVTDFGVSEQQAIDLYFQSETYGKLINESTALYLKPWQRIYEMLKSELKKWIRPYHIFSFANKKFLSLLLEFRHQICA